MPGTTPLALEKTRTFCTDKLRSFDCLLVMSKKPKRPAIVLTGGYLLLFAIAVLGSLGTSTGRANGSGAGSTGAPCDNSVVCGHPVCHGDNSFGITTQAFELRDLITGDAVSLYVPGTSYEARVRVFSGAGTGLFGFQATALNIKLRDAGTWFEPGSNVQIAAAPDCNNNSRTYVEHASPHFLSTFIMKWKAPDCNIGPVTFYFAGNKVNNNGAPSGDSGGMGDSATYHPLAPDHLVLDESSIQPGHYWANNSIRIGGTLSTADSVSLAAGDSVTFEAGLHVEQGAALNLAIHDCPQE